jgi:protein-export membrane protein SecD
MAAALRGADPPIRFTGRGVEGDVARVRLVDPAQMAQARRALAIVANAAAAPDTLAFVEHEDGLIEARLPFAVARDVTRLAVAQSAQVIARRVNPSGVNPITVTAVGEDRILVEARGETDSERLRTLVGPTGMLTFHLVRELSPEERAAGPLPVGTMLAQPYPDSGAAAEVVERRPRLSGERIAGANPSADAQTGQFVLDFQLDAEGTRNFCRVTREHAGERFAVLLDGQVLTAPRINEPICGGGGQISGNFTPESANRLAVMLRAGALPAPLRIVEQGLRPPPER